jgi:hypothetical protein
MYSDDLAIFIVEAVVNGQAYKRAKTEAEISDLFSGLTFEDGQDIVTLAKQEPYRPLIIDVV